METTLTIQTSAPPAVPSSASAEASKPVTKRLVSLDAFRGWTMFWIVSGGAIMTGLQALGHHPVIDTIVYQLRRMKTTILEGREFQENERNRSVCILNQSAAA